jgi:acyl-CoA thioesterase
MTMSELNPDALAHQVGVSMFAADTATRDTMGMELLFCKPGHASLRMTVTDKHLNGHQMCHGGFIFTLADSTFAFACNSHNKATVASAASIDFLKPAHAGDVLTCVGEEQVMSGRHGVYDMTVRNQHEQVIALFRGKSAQIQGLVVPT